VSRHDLVAARLTELRGGEASGWTSAGAGGGCINSAALWTRGDERVFVKWNERPLPGQFAAEAAGLEALRASGSGLVVPAPLAFCDEGPGRSFLALEYVPEGRRQPDFDEALGRGLAALHSRSDPRGFGFELEGYCGATPQPNAWRTTWLEFYAEQRLEHQLRLACERGLDSEVLADGSRVVSRLEALLGPSEPSALIHGDLWSGNLHTSPEGAPGLIDPAAYYGHREAELGMMVLFGGFSERVFQAYDEAFPLSAGWRERLDLYTLYHVLNHYVLFGGSYGGQAARILARYA
jgi:protein-ribulosamine 3-kinase